MQNAAPSRVYTCYDSLAPLCMSIQVFHLSYILSSSLVARVCRVARTHFWSSNPFQVLVSEENGLNPHPNAGLPALLLALRTRLQVDMHYTLSCHASLGPILRKLGEFCDSSERSPCFGARDVRRMLLHVNELPVLSLLVSLSLGGISTYLLLLVAPRTIFYPWSDALEPLCLMHCIHIDFGGSRSCSVCRAV